MELDKPTRHTLLRKLEIEQEDSVVPLGLQCPGCHADIYDEKELVVWTTWEEVIYLDEQLLRCRTCLCPPTRRGGARAIPYDVDLHGHLFGATKHQVVLRYPGTSIAGIKECQSVLVIGQCFDCETLFDAREGFGLETLMCYPRQALEVQFCPACYRARRRRGLRMSYDQPASLLTGEELDLLYNDVESYHAKRASVLVKMWKLLAEVNKFCHSS
jgi:hypothetical protein